MIFLIASIVGLWKGTDGSTPQPRCIVAVYEHEGIHYGRMLAAINLEGEVVDTIYEQKKLAPGIEGNPPYCGMDILYGLQLDDDVYKGYIVDPNGGSIYKAEVWMEDGDLKVRGKLWVFGKTITWPAATPADFPGKVPDFSTFVPSIPQTK